MEDMRMPLELTVTAKGQVTLPKAVLRHLGIKPGDKIEIALLDGGRVELAPPVARDFSRLRGVLRRPGQPVVTLQQMHDAIGSGGQR
jgi:AbrB family looped-hinge helix DNA binding protein